MKSKLFFILLLVSFISFGQQFQLTPSAEISVLTFGPGQSLNDAFGHNAFRVKDKTRGVDLVYGYGQYDFDAPNFYLKFARGKLNYMISKNFFPDVYHYYSSYNRSIDEQVLNLSQEEKQRFYNFLENNYKPENRRYLYDFFYDNCATKIRDVAQKETTSTIDFNTPENFEPKTFRELIREHLNQNSWGSFGIDVALGSVIDRKATAQEYMFLPKYIHSFFETATLDGKPLIKESNWLYKSRPEKTSSGFFYSPLFVLGLLAALILYITYTDYKNNRRSQWLDIVLFSITGLVGLLLLFLWFGTDHTATAYNYNLLWAMPLNLIAINQLLKKQTKNWYKAYLKFLIIMLCLMTLHWIIGVQVFAIGLIPLLIALLVRYVYLVKFFSAE